MDLLRAGTSTLALRLALSRHTRHYLKVDLDQTFANQNQQFPDQTGQDIKFVIFGGVGILEGLLVCRLWERHVLHHSNVCEACRVDGQLDGSNFDDCTRWIDCGPLISSGGAIWCL